MDLVTLTTFAIALAIAAAIPGPGIAALVGRSLASGFWPTLPMVLGFIAGDLTYLTLAVFGLAFIAKGLGTFLFVVKWGGIVYLGYLAWKFWNTQPQALKSDEAARPTTTLSSFLGGFAVTLSNPKTITFYLALVPTLVDITRITLVSYGQLALVVFVVLSIVITSYVALAAHARTLFTKPTALRRMNRVAATCLAGAAVGMATKT